MLKDFIKNYWLALASFIFSVFITLFFFLQLKDSKEDRLNSNFKLRTSIIQASIERRMQFYVHLLKTGKSYFINSDTVTRNSWKNFVRDMEIADDFPGFQGLAYAEYVKEENLNQHIEKVRSEGFEDYTVKPLGQRKEYVNIVFIEPFNWRNKRALGYDMNSEPVRRIAMAKARDLNAPVMSGKLLLIQETNADVQPGFILYIPIYKKKVVPKTIQERRENLLGYIGCPFRMNDFINGIFHNQHSDIDIEIFDETSLNAEGLLYNSHPGYSYLNKDKNPLNLVKTINIAGHKWTVLYSAQPQFMKGADKNLTYFVLVGGLIISVLIFSVMFFIIRSRQAEAKQNEELKEINADLDNFVYSASHDLKAPINNIEGLINAFSEEVEPEEKEQLIKMIKVSVNRFKDTIQDLAVTAKMQSGIGEQETPIYFTELLQEVKTNIAPLIKESNVQIVEDFSEAPSIRFSKKNLRSVLYNLVSNAIKYRSPDRKPFVKIKTKIYDGNLIMLEVEDNGLGIKEVDYAKVFAMYERIHDHIEGTGIGMSLVQKIIDNSGGNIEIRSMVNEGTIFKIYFNSKA